MQLKASKLFRWLNLNLHSVYEFYGKGFLQVSFISCLYFQLIKGTGILILSICENTLYVHLAFSV